MIEHADTLKIDLKYTMIFANNKIEMKQKFD